MRPALVWPLPSLPWQEAQFLVQFSATSAARHVPAVRMRTVLMAKVSLMVDFIAGLVERWFGFIAAIGSEAQLAARINQMSMVVVVVSGGLVVAFEKTVLNFPKKIFRQPVEQCNGDPMLFGSSAERQTLSGHTRIVVPRAVIKILRLKIGRRA